MELQIHVINRDTGVLSAYTPKQLARMARAFVRPSGRKYQCHWIEADQSGNTRLVVQSIGAGGWSQSDGIAI